MRRNGKIAAVIAFLLLYLLCSLEINTGHYLTAISKYEFLSPSLMYARMCGGVFSLFFAGLLLMRLRRPAGGSRAGHAILLVVMIVSLIPIICFLMYLFGVFAVWAPPIFVLRIARASVRPAPLLGLLAGICLGLAIPKYRDD